MHGYAVTGNSIMGTLTGMLKEKVDKLKKSSTYCLFVSEMHTNESMSH